MKEGGSERAKRVHESIRRKPRLGFLGTGWIGRNRLEAVVRSGTASVAAIADPEPGSAAAALQIASGAEVLEGIEQLLALKPDGIVIATPSALHAEQAVSSLRSGCAVFCQKPLGRTAAETRAVVDQARDVDRSLGVDLSYRYTRGARILRERIGAGDVGDIYAAELVFHNAYGPDKAWFYDPVLAGGGCVLDLGIHLVDLLLWVLDFPRIEAVGSRLFRGGRPLDDLSQGVEDYAVARIDLANGASASLACSWNLPAGRDAVIRAVFYGIHGGIGIENVGGSFYDFRTLLFRRTTTVVLAEGPDDWGGRAVVEWAGELAGNGGFDPGAENIVRTAEAIDALYRRHEGDQRGMRRFDGPFTEIGKAGKQ